MKALSVSELNNIAATLKPLVGTRLQEVQSTPNDLVLGFYGSTGLLWLWIDLSAAQPSVLPWTDLPMRLKWEKSPLHLFLRAHFSGHVLTDIQLSPEHGRVLRLFFSASGDAPREIELRIFPHARNVLARAEKKQVCWQKPSELEPLSSVHDGGRLVRSLDELREQWLASRQPGGRGKKARGVEDAKLKIQQELKRKEKALAKVDEELLRKKELPWRQVGDWLKEKQSLNVPKEWEPFVDRRRKLSWNIEECFGRARDLEGKLFGAEKRREILLGDIARLNEQLNKPAREMPAEPVDQKAPPAPLVAAEAQGRSLKVSNEVTVIAGKSASDNMKLLRKARSWDLWIHLRDYPSSHAIVFRNKSTKVTGPVLNQILDWFVRQQLGKKFAQHGGERFQIIVAECRYVRPIKGDRLGRVTYQNEQTLIYKVPS